MNIKEIINQRYAMPDASLDRLRQCLTEVSYPKGFRVLESGKIEKDIFFIKKGIVRAYTSVDGKEITFWVGKEGATLVSMKGYVNNEPGYETMELMEDSVLYVLERKKLKELFSKDLHIANWGRRYAEMELLATEERLISMLSAIASERYKELLKKEPDLLQRLPLGNIATYLGITQASLSRIRAQIKHSLRMIFSNKFASKDSTRSSFNNKQHYKWHYHKAHSFLQPLPCTILV